MPENEDRWHEARRKALAYANHLTDEEDARPWTDEMWAKAVTFDERQKQRALARTASIKVASEVGLRIDADVIEYFRKTGHGWQGRINEVLRKAAGLR